MSKLEIIGLSGKAGSGKDFVGRAILRPAGYHQWAFAWPMKMQCMGLGESYADVMYNKPPKVRQMLQVVGTEEGWMKHGRMYWVDQAEGWMRTMQENLGLSRFYITDVRFEHEAQWIRSMGGKLVRLEHGDRPYPLAGTEAARHSSETALDFWADWDVVILNNVGTSWADLFLAMSSVIPALEGDHYELEPPPGVVVYLTRGKGGVLGRYTPTDGGEL